MEYCVFRSHVCLSVFHSVSDLFSPSELGQPAAEDQCLPALWWWVSCLNAVFIVRCCVLWCECARMIAVSM